MDELLSEVRAVVTHFTYLRNFTVEVVRSLSAAEVELGRNQGQGLTLRDSDGNNNEAFTESLNSDLFFRGKSVLQLLHPCVVTVWWVVPFIRRVALGGVSD